MRVIEIVKVKNPLIKGMHGVLILRLAFRAHICFFGYLLREDRRLLFGGEDLFQEAIDEVLDPESKLLLNRYLLKSFHSFVVCFDVFDTGL
jgi:hypothetical protein